MTYIHALHIAHRFTKALSKFITDEMEIENEREDKLRAEELHKQEVQGREKAMTRKKELEWNKHVGGSKTRGLSTHEIIAENEKRWTEQMYRSQNGTVTHGPWFDNHTKPEHSEQDIKIMCYDNVELHKMVEFLINRGVNYSVTREQGLTVLTIKPNTNNGDTTSTRVAEANQHNH